MLIPQHPFATTNPDNRSRQASESKSDVSFTARQRKLPAPKASQFRRRSIFPEEPFRHLGRSYIFEVISDGLIHRFPNLPVIARRGGGSRRT